MTVDTVLVYAAGLGTRMGPLTATRPKPLIEVGGRALIDHALALTHGLRRVVNLHYLGDRIRAHLDGTEVAFSDESDLLRETGGGLRHAAPLLGAGPVLTLNTDAVWDGPNPLDLLRAAWRDGMEGLLLVADRGDAVGYRGDGDFILGPDGRIARGPGVVYTGAQIVRTERFLAETRPVFSTNLIWDRMIAAGTLYGLRYPGRFADVGRPESIPLAAAMIGAAA